MAVNSGRTLSNRNEIWHQSTKEQASGSMAAHQRYKGCRYPPVAGVIVAEPTCPGGGPCLGDATSENASCAANGLGHEPRIIDAKTAD